MTGEPTLYLAMAGAALAGLAIVAAATLAGWRGWLRLRHEELHRAREPRAADGVLPNASARIEIADLKERVRKLEAIAAGVEL